MTIASTGTPSIRERLERLRPAVVEVAQRYGASNLRVFGSVALNQEHADSDLDLLVDLPANQSLLALVGISLRSWNNCLAALWMWPSPILFIL